MPDAAGRPDQTDTTLRLNVPYSEYTGDGEGGEGFSPDQSSAARVLDVDPTKTNDFIAAMLGDSYIDNGKFLRRYLPERHPRFPWMYASSVDRAKSMGAAVLAASPAGNRESQYKLARYKVTYTPRLYALAADSSADASALKEFSRFVEVRGPKISHEAYPLPGTSFVWTEGSLVGQPVMEPAGQVFPIGHVQVIWRDLPAIQRGLSGRIGGVNDVIVDVPGLFSFEKETLLWMAADWVPKMTSATGRKLWDCEITWMWRPSTWNALYCKADSRFRAIARQNRNPPYTLVPFMGAFDNNAAVWF